MPREEKRGTSRRPAQVRKPYDPDPSPEPPRFKQRIREKAKLEKEVHKRNRPAKAASQSQPEPEQEPSAEEAEPEDLLERTRLRYKKARQNRKKVEARYEPAKYDPDDPIWDDQHLEALFKRAIAWEERYKREYEDAKRGEDTTDFLGQIRKTEENRLGRPLGRRGPRWHEPGIVTTPGETVDETRGRIIMRQGYDPDIPQKRPVFGPRRSQRLRGQEGEAEA